MTKYAIELNIEGHKIRMDCKDRDEFEHWSERLQAVFPDKNWKTRIEK